VIIGPQDASGASADQPLLQMHGIVTHVIDQDGRMRARFHGLKFAPISLVTLVNALTNGLQKPHDEPSFWDRVKDLF